MNRGRVAIPIFLARASEALGQTLAASALVALKETDGLIDLRSKGYQNLIEKPSSGYRRLFPRQQSKIVYSLADQLADALGEESVFWLTSVSEVVGAVRVPAVTLLRHTASVIKIDGDSVHALSYDGHEGLLIDSNPDDPVEAFEIAIWGKRWPNLI